MLPFYRSGSWTQILKELTALIATLKCWWSQTCVFSLLMMCHVIVNLTLSHGSACLSVWLHFFCCTKEQLDVCGRTKHGLAIRPKSRWREPSCCFGEGESLTWAPLQGSREWPKEVIGRSWWALQTEMADWKNQISLSSSLSWRKMSFLSMF